MRQCAVEIEISEVHSHRHTSLMCITITMYGVYFFFPCILVINDASFSLFRPDSIPHNASSDPAHRKAAAETEPPLSSALEALLAWATGAWSVLEAGDWRAVRFGVVEFWGWASVAGYVALVEALPVMLQPLHGVFR